VSIQISGTSYRPLISCSDLSHQFARFGDLDTTVSWFCCGRDSRYCPQQVPYHICHILSPFCYFPLSRRNRLALRKTERSGLLPGNNSYPCPESMKTCFLLCPPIAQRSGRFKMVHIDVNYRARAKPERCASLKRPCTYPCLEGIEQKTRLHARLVTLLTKS
jgi:hypothetical protein